MQLFLTRAFLPPSHLYILGLDTDCPRQLPDNTVVHRSVVVYHNPYDNVKELAHLFFKRCLDAKVTPYIVTKKTVFKWQEGFWMTMKEVFDSEYKVRLEISKLQSVQHITSRIGRRPPNNSPSLVDARICM
jgi:hypothetical protein